MGIEKYVNVKIASFWIVFGLILFGLMFLPQDIKEKYFVLDKSSPKISTMFLSSFVHTDWEEHFKSNILAIAILAIVFSTYLKDDKNFFLVAAAILIVTPFISSLFSLLIGGRGGTLQGASGVISAFIGYFTVLFGIKSKNIFKKGDNLFILLLICLILLLNFLISFLVIDYLKSINPFLVIVLSSCIIVATAFIWKQEDKEIVLHFKDIIAHWFPKKLGLHEIVINIFVSVKYILIAVVLFFLPMLLKYSRNGNTQTDVAVHYGGYLTGLIIPIFIYLYDSYFNKNKNRQARK